MAFLILQALNVISLLSLIIIFLKYFYALGVENVEGFFHMISSYFGQWDHVKGL